MDVLIGFFTDYGYFAVFFVLVICGIRRAIFGRYYFSFRYSVISGLGYANPHTMLIVSIARRLNRR